MTDREDMLSKAAAVGILSTADEDVRSLRELITYGLKGMAAYAHHALNLGQEDAEIYAFIYKALDATLNDGLSIDELVSLTLETGKYGVDVMALLDGAHTSRFGNPGMTEVNIGVRNNPAILISGHDLTDLEQLLEQTEGTGVDVYTHSEMLPAHYYPAFRSMNTLWGTTATPGGSRLQNSNPLTVRSVHNELYRTSQKRKSANTLPQPGQPAIQVHPHRSRRGREGLLGHYRKWQVLPSPSNRKRNNCERLRASPSLCPGGQNLEAVQSGSIKVLCDGRLRRQDAGKEYYTDFAQALPEDNVILTAGCASTATTN